MPASLLAAAGLSAVGLGTAFAGSFSADFNNALVPPGTAVNGHAYISASGGVGNSGVCHLTDASPSQNGSFIIDDLDAGAAVNGLELTFKNRTGGGSPHADGWAFCFGNIAMNQLWSEIPPATGLGVGIDTYNNGGEAPSINVYWNGTQIGQTMVTQAALDTGSEFVDVRIRLYSSGMVDVSFRGIDYYKNLVIPGFAPISGARYGWSGRTGGATDNQWIDNIVLTTTTGGVDPGFSRQPMSQTVVAGASAAFYPLVVNAAVINSIQWELKAPGETEFSEIVGATTLNYKTDPLLLADSGSQYRAILFGGSGVNVTSTVATVTVIAPPVLPTPDKSYDFEDGNVPPGTVTVLAAGILPFGGVGGGFGMQIVPGSGGQQGAWIVGNYFVDELSAPKPAGAMTARFLVRVGDNSIPPADGWSFNWASDFPTTTFPPDVEEGAGTGLTVCVDTYDNGTGDFAPGVDVKFRGAFVAHYPLPYEYLLTGSEFAEVVIQLRANGLLDVVINGLVLYHNLQIPDWSALTGAQFGWGSRTGGAWESVILDNVELALTEYVGPILFVTQPQDVVTIPGQTATFSVAVNDPAHASYQWFRKAPADPGFAPILGAMADSYTTPVLSLADDGTLYYCEVTGPSNVTNSRTATLTVLDLGVPANPDFCYNFDDGQVPAGSAVYGSARVDLTGGVGDSGKLNINDAVGSVSGAWVKDNFLTDQAIDGFSASFDIKVDWTGVWHQADGWSFNVASDLPAAAQGNAEDGVGTGLSICVDTYDNGGGEAPAIDVKWKGVFIATTPYPVDFVTSPDYQQMLVKLNLNGTLDLAYRGRVIYHNLALPGFQPMSNLKWGFYGRTGGAYETHYVDNFCLETHRYAGPIAIIKDPADLMAPLFTTVTFTAASSDPSRTTWQWQMKLPGETDFSDVFGATSDSFSTELVSLGESPTLVRALASSTFNTATSRVASLTALVLPEPQLAFNFDFCQMPPNTRTMGVAGLRDLSFEGYPEHGCVMQITPNANGVQGAFVVDPDPGAPTQGITDFSIYWDMLLGGGTDTPADGVSLVVTANPLTAEWGEEGAGGQFVVSYDTYVNPGEETPSIDLRWMGENVAHYALSIPELVTWPTWVTCWVQVTQDGKATVVFNNRVIFNRVQLPRYAGFATNPKVGWGGRTGGLNENAWVDNIQIAFSREPLPALTITPIPGNKAVITFSGVLQSADVVTGPYTDILVAVSPWTVDLPTGAGMKFYRSRTP